jgi:hypothetical protein
MADWEKVELPGVPASYLGSERGWLLAEVDSDELLAEARRDRPIRSLLERLRGNQPRPDRHVLKIWNREYGDFTVAWLVYDPAGAVRSVRYDRIFETEDITPNRPVETPVDRSRAEVMADVGKFFSGAPNAVRLLRSLEQARR